MKKQGKAVYVIDLLGIALSRVVVMGTCPVAMGFFGACCQQKNARILAFLAVCLGLYTKVSTVEFVKYAVIMLAVLIITALVESRANHIPIYLMGAIVGLVTGIISFSNAYYFSNITEKFYLCLLEGVLAFVLTVLFQKGFEWFTKWKGKAFPGNEELISITLAAGFFIYSLGDVTKYGLSISLGAACFAVLLFGYRFGAGFGSCIGVAAGLAIGIQRQEYLFLAILCILGLLAGTFREMGRILTTLAYLGAMTFVEVVYDRLLPDMTDIYVILGAAVLFLILPASLVRRLDIGSRPAEDGEKYLKENIQNITQTKLKEFSESFHQLSSTFQEITRKKITSGNNQVLEVMDDISSQLCSNCSKYDLCWKNNYSDTYNDMKEVLGAIKDQGVIDRKTVPKTLSKRCEYVGTILNEGTRLFETAKLNSEWQNRLAESREAIAGQLSEVACIIDEFSNDLYRAAEPDSSVESQIRNVLKSHHIQVNQLVILERKDKKQLVYLFARALKGQCVTTKEVAGYIGSVLGKPMKLVDGTKNVIKKSYETFAFVEDTAFQVVTGMARTTKQGEKISGDSFSFLTLESGKMILSLSDGMGTGIEANEESESVIELLEQFMEAGFKEESAIRLINSILVLKSEDQSFSTIDLSMIDLYTGVCEFMKIGASATFIRRDHWVETISSTTMPAGVFNQVDFDQKQKKLYDGDYVVMMTDGVLDCIKDPEKEKAVQAMLMEIKTNNPQEIANTILSRALEENEGVPLDDMTILVAGLWKKT